MWHMYRVEHYPHVGQFTGIVDAFGHELTFPRRFGSPAACGPRAL
jgi:hypothetical protein